MSSNATSSDHPSDLSPQKIVSSGGGIVSWNVHKRESHGRERSSRTLPVLLVLRGFKMVFRAPHLSHIHIYPRYEEHCSVAESVASSQPDYAPRGQPVEFAHQGNLNSLLIVISSVQAERIDLDEKNELAREGIPASRRQEHPAECKNGDPVRLEVTSPRPLLARAPSLALPVLHACVDAAFLTNE